MNNEILFVCLYPDNSVQLKRKSTVVSDGISERPYILIKGINTTDETNFYLLTCTMPKTIIYDVVVSANARDAEVVLRSKKRFAGKELKVQRALSLKPLIEQYNE